jgi:SNF2 family DNA or RNA helicase
MSDLELFKFQQEAVDQLWPLASVLIGDEMGTGKTVQGVALDVRRRQDWRALISKVNTDVADKMRHASARRLKTLVIAPLSVTGVWKEHYAQWAPHLTVCTLDPKHRPEFLAAAINNDADVYICHWEALRLLKMHEKRITWFHIIADEVHRAKNRKTQQTQALWKLPTVFKTALSGTAAENRPDDLWAVLHWLYPKTWSSYWRFFNHHVLFKTIENPMTGRSYREIIGVACVEELQKQMKPFYVRRLKKQVLPDLPDKYYTTLHVQLGPQQRRIYNDMRKHMLAWIGEHEEEPLAAPVVIAQLTRLQQFAIAYAELKTEVRKVLIKNHREGSPCATAGKCQGHKATTVKLTDPSAKLDLVMELVQDNPDEQIVVFSQSKQAINLLASRLKAQAISYGIITGDISQGERNRMVQDFQEGRRRIFLGTTAAGGEGITLTAASTVIFLDRDWRPSRNRQAEDRLHRAGQKNAVQVIDIVADGTIDQGRNQKIEDKWQWLRRLLGDT